MSERRLGLVLLLGLLATGCNSAEETARRLTGGEPERGRALIRGYGCQTCHTVPGVPGADGMVGPPLDRIASRTYLAGRLPNTPQNLMRWIRDPQGISPGTAMPNLHVSEKDGRDIAAFLYTLK
ncbi:MAG TPA: c-type cytochrome [Thermoanaerobaculia bacterium]|jgi:cytochrome c2|nr:c-type cytochrome [Thermoanaerobaculia bacterium]